MTTQTYHIRQLLTPQRGNCFYKDQSNRGNGTVCGAPETIYDCRWADRYRANNWVHNNKTYIICEECKKLVIE